MKTLAKSGSSLGCDRLRVAKKAAAGADLHERAGGAAEHEHGEEHDDERRRHEHAPRLLAELQVQAQRERDCPAQACSTTLLGVARVERPWLRNHNTKLKVCFLSLKTRLSI